MLNLIPPAARKSVIREYWVRAVTVFMFLLGTGFLLVASFLLPTYVLIDNQVESMQAEVDARAATTASFDASSGSLTNAMKQANTLLAAEGGAMVPATVLTNTLDTLSGPEVDLTQVSFTKTAATTTLMISGQAKNRPALAGYRDAIEGHEYFLSADLPISSLVKDKDLLFTMTIVVDPAATVKPK